MKPGLSIIDGKEGLIVGGRRAVTANLQEDDQNPHNQQRAGGDQPESRFLDNRLAKTHRLMKVDVILCAIAVEDEVLEL